MRVLVTGAQGTWKGAWVVKILLQRGADVVLYNTKHQSRRALSSSETGDARARIPLEVGKIEDTARLKSLVKDGGVTHIMHLAAVLMPFCQADPVEGGMINVIGTLSDAFAAARDARPSRACRLRKFVGRLGSRGALRKRKVDRGGPRKARHPLRRLQAGERGQRPRLLSRQWHFERWAPPLDRLRRRARSRAHCGPRLSP